jgi:hypothetical protein
VVDGKSCLDKNGPAIKKFGTLGIDPNGTIGGERHNRMPM